MIKLKKDLLSTKMEGGTMNRSHWILVVLCFIFYTIAWLLYNAHDSYESYLLGRERERINITRQYPVIGMGIYKDYCVDGGLNVHEVRKIGGKFLSKKIHEVRNGDAP